MQGQAHRTDLTLNPLEEFACLSMCDSVPVCFCVCLGVLYEAVSVDSYTHHFPTNAAWPGLWGCTWIGVGVYLTGCVCSWVCMSVYFYICMSDCVWVYLAVCLAICGGSVFLAYVGIGESMHPAVPGCLGFVQKDSWRKFPWAQTQQHLLRCSQASESVYLMFQEMRLRTAASAES